jgi:molybdate transport system ATP-binding protein
MELRVNASKAYGRVSLEYDFAISGDRVGLFGESGSGKSTLVGMLAGLVQPDRGEICLDGTWLYNSTTGTNIPPERRRISVVFQHHALFPHLSVRSNLLYGFRRSSSENRTIDFDTLVDVLRLGSLLDRGVNNLSGGEKQRVALGRAVLANPRLLLMDEPLTGLDDTLRFQIIPYLKSVGERFNIPYIFISHSLVEMRLMADRVLVAEGGRIAEEIGPEQLARKMMGQSLVGYINLLRLSSPRREGNLFAYPWGDTELLISAGSENGETLFELSSRDIILCKQHPEAVSARNLIACRVVNTFQAGNRIAVELASGCERLIAEVVGAAASELGITEGAELFAVIKAVAFRRMG